MELYKRLRPGEPPTVDSARSLFKAMFFESRRYDLARVGRYKLNKRLKIDVPMEIRHLSPEDIVATVRHLLLLMQGKGRPDDIDHLGTGDFVL